MGTFGRQPVYWLLRERGMAQASLSTVVGRSVSFVNGVLNGAWVPDMAFVTAVSRFLQLPKERLFSAELLEASSLRSKPRLAHLAQARRARVGRLGRQPAYWVLRERRIRQAEVSRLTGQSSGYVSLVFNGSMVPTPSFIDCVAGFLGLAPGELFTEELLESTGRRIPGLAGPFPSRRVGRYGRQRAYWLLRKQGIRQADLASFLGRSGGYVSSVLNGYRLPDRRFVEVVSAALKVPSSDLFTDPVLTALEPR